MTSVIQIAQMSRKEKLQTMEAIWADLSRDDTAVESPEWHENILKETAARMVSGQERISDWTIAKRDLRNRFE